MSDTEDNIQNDKSLQCIRIELNTHISILLYYKVYPKNNSERFPQNRTAIFFFFDHLNINEKLLKEYISQMGDIDEIQIGSYINKKGSKKKRKIVNFALIKFMDEESLNFLMKRHQAQMKINEYIENRKNKKIQLSYDPLKDEEDQFNENEENEDEDGFVKVSQNDAKKRFSKNGLSFKVAKKTDVEEDNIEETHNIAKTPKEEGDFYWNFQILNKKKKSK